jgi:hypothetical protein
MKTRSRKLSINGRRSMYVVSTQQQQQVGPERVQPETTFPPFHQTHPVFSLSLAIQK